MKLLLQSSLFAVLSCFFIAIIAPDIPYVNRIGTTGSKTAQLVCTNQNFARFSMFYCVFCTIALAVEKISKL